MKKNATSLVSILMASGLALAGTFAFGQSARAQAGDPGTGDLAAERDAEQVPPDNSGRNVRDRSDQAVTSGDQSNSAADVKITADIRKAVVDDEKLSTNAHNVKIVTAGGMVTLRGPVKDDAEKRTIEEKAKKVAGVTKVDNQLEVTGE